MAYPEIQNKSPIENATGVDGYALISFDAYDSGSNIDPSSFRIYVGGTLAFTGPNTFHAPFNGTHSVITEATISGTDGYHVIIESTVGYTSNTLYPVRVVVEDFSHLGIDDTWTIRTGNRVLSIVPSLYEVVLDVTFEQPFSITSATGEPASYVFTNGMYARKAEILTMNTVRLWVELFHTHREFSLTVSPSVVDDYGNGIPTSYNGFVFSPFSSTADLANFNGRVRTWRDSHLVYADTNCVYLGGTKGIDVFNKHEGRWAQIYNENKQTHSLFVANFGGVYNFAETGIPYLFNVSPVDGSIAPYNAMIIFSVGDLRLAIEPTALRVYVNNILAFDGSYGGWYNGFSGFVDVQYKHLDVAIKPATPYHAKQFVTVRVVAEDLIGNTLDTHYTYRVTSAPIISSGWGYSYWGATNYGLGTI